MGCSKKKHSEYKSAERALRYLRKYHSNYKGEVYHCKLCGFLHVGRKRKDARKDYQV